MNARPPRGAKIEPGVWRRYSGGKPIGTSEKGFVVAGKTPHEEPCGKEPIPIQIDSSEGLKR